MRRSMILFAVLALGCFSVGAAAEDKAPAYSFKFSGYLKADMAYDQTRVSTGNYALYVLDRAENDVLSTTARESRLGLDFSWKENDYATDARFEIDFYGLGVTASSLNSMENKAAPMLRHAYLQITKGHWSILAGQTSDIISPLVPRSVNYTVCWDQGNVGYRRPQFRLSTWANAGEKLKVSAAVGAMRTLGGNLDDSALEKVDDGADAAIPTVQGRVAFAVKPCAKRLFEIGFSGHYGTEEYQAAGETKSIESWSANADLKASFSPRFEVAGELFTGENLGAYLGTVGQTVNSMKEEIGGKGGWAQVSIMPVNRLWLNAGYSIDDPDEEDFAIAEGATAALSFIDKNTNIFGSATYDVTSTVTAMLEVSQLTTTYVYKTYIEDALSADTKDFDNLRVQFALKAAIK